MFWYFKQWRADGTVDRIHDALRDRVRDEAGRDPMAARASWTPSRSRARTPSAPTRAGFDAGKKVNGRKRHIVVDTMGLLLAVIITTAAVQDRDGARRVLDRLRFTMPSVALVWADGGYGGQLVGWACESAARQRRDRAQTAGNQDLPRAAPPLGRRTHLRLDGRCRRLAHDYERLPEHSEAMIKWAMIGLMTRRLAPAPGRRPWQPSTIT